MPREEKRRWLESMVPERAGAKLAYDQGQLAGMAEYSLIEDSPFPIAGKDLLHLNCVWILPRYQKRGFGRELVKACLSEARRRAKIGLSVVAYHDPFFMPSSFFGHEGFRGVEVRGREELMWRNFEDIACEYSIPPRFLENEYSPGVSSRKVFVNVTYCAQCPWSVKTRERLEKVSREFPEVVVLSIRADAKETVAELGGSRSVFVDGKEVFLPTPTEDNVRSLFAARVQERKLCRGISQV